MDQLPKFSEFEYDADKRDANFRKHGIDFADAAAIFEGESITALARPVDGEVRYLATGKTRGRWVTVVFTLRGEAGNVCRLISMRPARRKEVDRHAQVYGSGAARDGSSG